MDVLPRELLESILIHNVHMCRYDKNSISPLRLVCKAFDAFLKPYIFKTIQLEFSNFLRNAPGRDLVSLDRVGNLCQALYVDMMVIRDEDEIARLIEILSRVTTKVPELGPLLHSLRRFCMNESTFDETDFRRHIERVLSATPNLTRVKLHLPFQVLERTSSAATLLLATILACIANRDPEEYKPIKVLVLDHISDTTLLHICNNPIDIRNTLTVFSGLETLVLVVKRQEAGQNVQNAFASFLWFLIRKAGSLNSMCLLGCANKRDIKHRVRQQMANRSDWAMHSLPYHSTPNGALPMLRNLELKLADIDPQSLINLIKDNAGSLKEIYLIDVYLKVSDTTYPSLWVGFPDKEPTAEDIWVARKLRDMETLQLDVLRASRLGYDCFNPDGHPITRDSFDLKDPREQDRSLDRRFIHEVLHPDDPVPDSPSLDMTEREDWDADTFQKHHNTTSEFKRYIDGYFLNHHDKALNELQTIIEVADRGMSILSEELEVSQAAPINANGTIGEVP